MVDSKKEKITFTEEVLFYASKDFTLWNTEKKKRVKSPMVDKVFMKKKIPSDNSEPFYTIDIVDFEGTTHSTILKAKSVQTEKKED